MSRINPCFTMTNLTLDRLAYLTADLPGIGGRLKARPEDFRVEEIPLYQPCGEGEHYYLWVEKCRRLTSDVTRILGEHLGVGMRQFGFAGLKDKHAVTRQYISISGIDPARLDTFDDDLIKILSVDRHTNKLKRGHLRGNRFLIKLRQVEPTDAVKAKAVMDRLVESSCPSFVGEQRFGYRMDSHLLGRSLLLGDWQGFLDQLLGRPQPDELERNQEARLAYERGAYGRALELWPTVHRFERQAVGPLSRGAPPADAVNGIDRTQRTLLVSAFQSMVFNRVLNRRMAEGLFGRMLEGDVAMKHINRACFTVREPQVDQPRLQAKEICPTGPMWGAKMYQPSGQVAQWEREALAETGVTEQDLASGGYSPGGARRPMHMPITNESVTGGADEHGPYVQVGFDLPRGSFATIVMREIMKGPGFWGTEPPATAPTDHRPNADPLTTSFDQVADE